ncbi:MAG TPA: hypothetical protein VFD01_06890 [Candidatus Dormibacteraeota bacterium]|jgi:hypothetical protein|nr:hypothetical protein [Candidatus Dormibacteraeota bacterium]
MAIQQAHSANDEVWLGRAVTVAGQAAAGLPAGSPPGWGRIAYRAVLSGVLRDWVDNGDTTLEGEDISTLTRFVRQAASAAGSAPAEFRDDTFEIVLGALMDDWVINWGGDSSEEDELTEDDDLED